MVKHIIPNRSMILNRVFAGLLNAFDRMLKGFLKEAQKSFYLLEMPFKGCVKGVS